MFNNLNIGTNAKRILAGGMVALMLTALPCCGKMEDSNLATRVESLSAGENSIKVDDYIEAIFDSQDTSMRSMENRLLAAYESKDKKATNEFIYNILTTELKALTAEGLGIDEDEMEEFAVTGYYLVPGFLSDLDTEESYGVYFKYHDHEYNIKANDNDAVTACFYARAAMKNQISLGNSTDTNYENAYRVLKDLLKTKFVFKETTISRDLAGDSSFDDLTNKIIYIGKFNLDKDKDKVKAMK